MAFKMKGFPMMNSSALKKENPMAGKQSTKGDDPTASGKGKRLYGWPDYKVGDHVDESDFESRFKQTGDKARDYPQYSIGDYSRVRQDDKGKYIENIGDEIDE
tara:strand:+ start:289 stop:597 length:309 start_codon:yes stop_codon:yes gene_type:complete